MKRLLPLLLLFLLCCGCERIELPDEATGQEERGEAPISPTYEGDTLSVAQVQFCPNDTTVLLKGYIVGYIDGTSITSGSTFSLPETAANPNMLLADTPYETDYLRCIPVKLENSTSYGFRAALNLYDHPENFQRPLVLLGWVGTYFRTKGLTRVVDFQWLGDAAETPPEEPEESGSETPGLDDNEEILQGR